MQKVWVHQTKRMQVMLQSVFLVLCVLIVFASPAGAEQKSKSPKGPKPVGTVNSSNGSVFPVGKYGVILKYYNIDKDQLYNGTDKVDFVRPQKGRKPGKKVYEKSIQSARLVLRTGIFENFDARLIVPYFFNKELKRSSFNTDFSDDNSGIGDIKLLSRSGSCLRKKMICSILQ